MDQHIRLEPYPILIIDDDIDLLKIICHELKKIAPVESYSKGKIALERLNQQKYSVALCDLSLEDMNGLDFLSVCYKKQPDCQRILMTAFADLANLEKSVNEARLEGLMSKPWKAGELSQSISQALRGSDIKRENRELRRLAWSDALTGLANHRYFWERLNSEFNRALRYERSIGLIIADIDDFKIFNDNFGHLKGDEILRKVATALSSKQRQMDTVARYGGEEFAIILPEANLKQSVEIAKRLQCQSFEQSGVTLSFGVAAFPGSGRSATELVHTADKALLKAKKQGKNQVVESSGL